MSLLSFASKVFQLIKTGSALPDVGEQVGDLIVRGLSHEFQQDFTPWTGYAPRVGKVFMHDPVKNASRSSFSDSMMHALSRIPRSVIIAVTFCSSSLDVPSLAKDGRDC